MRSWCLRGLVGAVFRPAEIKSELCSCAGMCMGSYQIYLVLGAVRNNKLGSNIR